MPIYEFYCPLCHTIFTFFSKTVNTRKRPMCPRCRKKRLSREISAFSMPGKAGDEEGGDLPIDESRMEQAIGTLAGEAERINEDDPRQAAQLMRKFSRLTGLKYGEGMQDALARMEAGEDPEKIEEEMGDVMDGEEPFLLSGQSGRGAGGKRSRGEPRRDEKLYEM